MEIVENDLSVETEAVSFDNARGNVAFQGSVSTGITGDTPSASLTFFQVNSNAPDIYKLEGIGYQVGGSIGVPVGILPLAGGLDFNIIPDSGEGEYFYGTTKSIGVGIPGMELHTEWGNTATLPVVQFNIFDSIDQFCISIMEW